MICLESVTVFSAFFMDYCLARLLCLRACVCLRYVPVVASSPPSRSLVVSHYYRMTHKVVTVFTVDFTGWWGGHPPTELGKKNSG